MVGLRIKVTVVVLGVACNCRCGYDDDRVGDADNEATEQFTSIDGVEVLIYKA